ncbi:putative immunoglobulin-blocking virulence protein [Mycoplasma tullyi]|uniref:Putative immunoglobulin-blocking virulence protein n=1 Tax=Mycoplasma tullyi TaxID=1612150 RepID=A0A7D7U454_9MOLU|nr:putative immunoglobulin-blocking virulence protein [Mycoplasma tullyi]QMT98510.1 putative immunoglobulin-blocking virulence protein [Mycoplasma tullyi]
MISSKKRKLIKLISLSATSILVAGSTTFGVVYSNSRENNSSNLIQRSNTVTLDKGGSTDSQYNSNRDLNLPKEVKPVVKQTPIVTPEKKPEPTPEPKPTPVPEVQPLPDPVAVTYKKTNYNLDQTTPVLPYDPSVQAAFGDKVGALVGESKHILNTLRNILSQGLAANTVANKELFKNTIGYKNNPDYFDFYWNSLFKKRDEPGRTEYPYQDFLNSFSALSDDFILSEAKANRVLNITLPNVSVTFGYKDPSENPLLNYYIKVNEKKLLGTPNWQYNENPQGILDGDYRGWTKTDQTQEFINSGKYGITADDGITVRHYTPTDKSEDYYKNKQPVNVFVLDVDNTSGYNKFIEFLKKAADTTKDIGVVLTNIGKTSTNRDVYDIIKALPKNVKLLTVFFENANTSSLLALEDRRLDELNIYTTGTVNTDLWGLNPLALKHTNFIPSTNNYNVGGFNPYVPGTVVASTPIFEALKFDRNDDYSRVQEGIDIAFNRRNERIFNGKFQGKGGKPVVWDFSDAPIIRSFRGLNIRDANLKIVRLSKDLITSDESGDHLVYNVSEFNGSQWTSAMSYQPERGKYITFGRGTELKQPDSLILLGKASDLRDAGDLATFIKYARMGGSFKTIVVTDPGLASVVRGIAFGANVILASPEEVAKHGYEPKVFKVDPTLNPIGDKLDKPSNVRAN